MPTFYTVVQYIPDPIAGERMNIGVLVCGGQGIKASFIKRWERARRFGGENVMFLREFAEGLKEELSIPQLGSLSAAPRCDEETIRKIVGSWKNSIQFTEPRASLKQPDELLEEVTRRFLHDPQRKPSQSRGRSAAVSLGFHSVGVALRDRFGEIPPTLLKRKHPLAGKLEEHTFDIVVANGRPFFAAEALSFEITDGEVLRKEVDAAAFAVDDVRKQHRSLPLAVLALPPKDGNTSYDRAKRIFRALGADFVQEGKLHGWAEEMAKAVRI